MNIKCEQCDKKKECNELCPAAKVSQLSGQILPSGEEMAKILSGRK